MSDLEEISNDELLSEAEEGSISLSDVSQKSNDDDDIDDIDDIDEDNYSITGSDDNMTSDESSINNDDDVVEDPWIELEEDDIVSSKDNLIKLSDDEDDEESEYDDEELKKLEKSNNKEILIDYHPEMKQINYKELITLTKITRDKNGIIIDPMHKTLPILTRYEKTKILGLRAKQINNGSSLFINVKRDIIDGHTIALLELEQKKIPFIIRRPLPNGQSEYWNIKDLEFLN